jgi:hypothetical protein
MLTDEGKDDLEADRLNDPDQAYDTQLQLWQRRDPLLLRFCPVQQRRALGEIFVDILDRDKQRIRRGR